MGWVCFAAGCWVGATFGVIIMAMVAVSKKAEEKSHGE